MNITEAAQHIGVTPDTVRSLCSEGIIERDGNELLIADVERVRRVYRCDRLWRLKQARVRSYGERRARVLELAREGRTIREVADALGISYAAAQKALERARKDNQ
jgi:DNA-directed RNA polymerase specialized sigma24 family protein